MLKNLGLGQRLGFFALVGLDQLPLLQHVGDADLTGAELQGHQFENLLIGDDLRVQHVQLPVLLNQLVPGAGYLGRKGQGRGLEVLFAGLHIEHGSIATGTNAAPQVQLVAGGQAQ